MLRYVVRTDSDLPIFLGLTTRAEKLAEMSEAVTLIADMERMGLVRRLRLERFSQLESAELVQQILGGRVSATSAATMHAQAEGVAFIVEELARTYRETGMIQEIDVAGRSREMPPACSRPQCAHSSSAGLRGCRTRRNRTSPMRPCSGGASALRISTRSSCASAVTRRRASPRCSPSRSHPPSLRACSSSTPLARRPITASPTTRYASSLRPCFRPHAAAPSTPRSSTC